MGSTAGRNDVNSRCGLCWTLAGNTGLARSMVAHVRAEENQEIVGCK
jgi:hypothetical protein